MDKEDILKFNKDVLDDLMTAKIQELDPSKVYLFQIEVGNASHDEAIDKLRKVRDCLTEFGIKGVYNAANNGVPYITATELKKYLDN